MASTYLTRTPSTAGNRRTGTFSAWVKRGSLGTLNSLLDCYTSFELTWFNIRFSATDQIQAIAYDATSGFQEQFELRPTRLFRDTSAWYHIVFSWDSTQATASDRVKFYVNGVRETSFSSASYPALDEDFYINYNSIPYWIGRGGWNSNYFNGSMSYVAFVDGTAELPTIFGETDSVTGQWKIKTDITPSVAWGTNGFLILKNGNSLTDESSNSNNWTLGAGTLTKTEDCPDNVFAVYNQLLNIPSSELSNGATTIFNASSASTRPILSSLGASSGKFYAEFKTVTASSASRVGICDMDKYVLTEFTGVNALSYGYLAGGTVANNNSTTISGLSSYTSGDIIGVYIDLDNNFLYFAKNGVLQNSGVPTSGATGTGGQAITANNTYGFHVTVGSSSKKTTANFGNGYFGTTAVSSAGTNASGIGIFEYDVPTGYTALSTKGLNL